VDGDPHQVIIVADLVGNFLVQALSPSPLADLFLVNQDGTLFANSSPGEMADFANAVWSQPVTQALSETSHPGQSFRWKFDKQAYIGGIAPTPIPGVFAVSQIAEADGLDILSELRQRSALAVIACACLCAFFNIWMASRTGRRLRRLAQRLDRLSAGDFSEVSKVNSWDETAEVSTAVERIAKEMPIQIEAAASNARAQSERALAVNLRAVLGADPKVNLPAIDICPHRPGDNIEAVDFWDCYADGPYLTFILGRTNSDGVGAGLFAAYAKSTLIAMRLIELRGGQKTSLVHQLQTLNDSLHLTYQGSHALEACAIRLHTETGICEVVNCGSETPFFLAGEVTSNTPMAGPTGAQIRETTQPRGSALGAQSGAVFQASQLQLKHGEFIFLFTHTLWRAPSLVERTQSRGRVGEHLLNSFHLTPQATSAHFLNKSPFGDEITFWLVEWRPLRVSIPDQKAG
jgi:HAMP domain-containing protein